MRASGHLPTDAMITKAKTTELHEQLEVFISDLTKTIYTCTDQIEIDILEDVRRTTKQLVDKIEPIL